MSLLCHAFIKAKLSQSVQVAVIIVTETVPGQSGKFCYVVSKAPITVSHSGVANAVS